MAEAKWLWDACTEALRGEVPEAQWRSCFQTSSAIDLRDDVLVVAVPSHLARERIEGRWSDSVRRALADVATEPLELALEVHPELDRSGHEPSVKSRSNAAQMSSSLLSTRDGDRPRRHATDAGPLNPRYTFDAFVIGTSNRFAHAAAMAVAETPARSYNPLFIYGVAGLGKTHLLHAIAHYVNEHYPDYRVRYVSLESFMNDFVEGMRTKAGAAFKRRYRENDVLLVDDVQFMEGKEGLQEEFYYTFNELHGADHQIVLSSDRPPRSIATLEDRLRGRFEWGLITDITPPDLETRLAILHKKAEREAVQVPDEVLEFIATHVTNNIRELEGALIRVSAFASLNGAPLTAEVTRQVLRDVLMDNKPRPLTAKLIIHATAAMYGFTEEELRGPSRRRSLTTARQIGMYVTRELTDLSYPVIGREYGGRDHTTVIHGFEKIAALMKHEAEIFQQVNELIHSIRSGA